MKVQADLTTSEKKFKGTRTLGLGIDPGTEAWRYVLTDLAAMQVLQWGECPMKVSPQEKDKFVRQWLRSLSKEVPKRRLHSISVNIQGQSVLLGKIQVTKASPADQENLIAGALAGQVPFPAANMVYFCREYAPGEIKPAGGAPAADPLFLHYAVTQRNALTSIVEPVVEHFQMVPDVTVQGYAFESLLQTLGLSEEGKTQAIVNIGRGITSICLFKSGKLLLQRDVPLASQDMTRSIMIMHRDPANPENMLTLDKADEIKKRLDVTPGREMLIAASADAAEIMDLSALDGKKVFQSVQGVLSAWIQDLKLTFSYFHQNFEAEKVTQVYLAGGGSNLKSFPAYLSQQLNVPVEYLAHREGQGTLTLADASAAPGLRSEFHAYAASLALSIKPEGYASLGIKQPAPKNLQKIFFSAGRIAAVLLSAVLITWAVFVQIQQYSLGDVFKAVSGHHDFLKKIESPYLELMEWRNFQKEIDSTFYKTSEILQGLSKTLSKKILVSKIDIHRADERVVVEGTLVGNAKMRAIEASEFARLLRASEMFVSVGFPRLNATPAGAEEGTFSIEAKIKKIVRTEKAV
ncbi:MAG: hypothetical protein ACOY3K_06145 [Candidatus Omnitrophota bacterium]